LVPIVVEPQVDLAIVVDLNLMDLVVMPRGLLITRVELAIVEDLKSHGFDCEEGLEDQTKDRMTLPITLLPVEDLIQLETKCFRYLCIKPSRVLQYYMQKYYISSIEI
jgi:hypothetical protein